MVIGKSVSDEVTSIRSNLNNALWFSRTDLSIIDRQMHVLNDLREPIDISVFITISYRVYEQNNKHLSNLIYGFR
jgi:NADH pyrophosphatase NudC (nudix superfamily)